MRWPFAGTIGLGDQLRVTANFVLAAATTIAVAMGLLTFAISQRILKPAGDG